jgi:hypothetical protein
MAEYNVADVQGKSKAGLSNAASAGAMALVIYFPGALIYSASFNVNQNFKKKNSE